MLQKAYKVKMCKDEDAQSLYPNIYCLTVLIFGRIHLLLPFVWLALVVRTNTYVHTISATGVAIVEQFRRRVICQSTLGHNVF